VTETPLHDHTGFAHLMTLIREAGEEVGASLGRIAEALYFLERTPFRTECLARVQALTDVRWELDDATVAGPLTEENAPLVCRVIAEVGAARGFLAATGYDAPHHRKRFDDAHGHCVRLIALLHQL
jgi:hypothetical protein